MTDRYYGFGPRGGGGGSGGGGGGIYRAPRPKFSEPVAAFNRGFGDATYSGSGANATEKRPFKLVGKNKINILDPTASRRQQEELYEQTGIEPVTKHEGIGGGILNYYDQGTPGGLFAGLLGVAGQAVGGIFGEEGAEQGSNIGAGLGKTFEIPFGVIGGLGLPDIFVPYIDQANAAIEPVTPYLMRDIVKVPQNIGDVAQSLLNLTGGLGRMVERTYAGFDERGGLPEDLAARVEKGELTPDEALDEMVLQGRGFSDDPWHNMALSMLTDPLNLATLGVGAVGTAIRGGTKLATQINRMGRVLNEVEHGYHLGALGDMVRAGRVVRPEDLQGLSRGDIHRGKVIFGRMSIAESKTNPLFKLAHLTRLHMVPSALEVLGPIPDVTGNLFYRAAKETIRLTDPGTWAGGLLFGTGAIGRRSMEYLATSSTAAGFSAYDPRNISALADIADGVDGGADLIMDTFGVHMANSTQEFGLSEHVADGLREGTVPVLSDSSGASLSSTEATRSLLRASAFDTNSGKHIELQIIKNMPNLYVRRAGETSEEATAARVLADSRLKLKSILGDTWDEARLTAGKMNPRMASLIHAMYYYRKGAQFHNEVVPVLVAAANAGALPGGIADPTRLTQVAERTLTKGRVQAIRDALATHDVSSVRTEIGKYADFDWLNPTKIDDREVIDLVTRWLDNNEGRLLSEVDFIDPATGMRWAGLPRELEDWLADADAGFGYRLAEAPPANIPKPDLYGAIYREDGTMVGMSPWLEFLANPAGALGGNWTAKSPGLAARYHQLVFGRVRQERIRWETQRAFITDMSKGSDVGGLDISPELSKRLWQGIMSEAEHQRLQPRGLAPQDFSRVVRRVLAEQKKTQDRVLHEAVGLTEHQVMNAFLRASKGDLFTVGATQYATGAMKAMGPGRGANFWGQIAEKVYPLMRFVLNPVFQLQELLEPHILNVMRGVSVPLDRNSEKFKEGLATHNAIMQLVRTSFEPDGMMSESAEYLRLYAADFLGVRQNFGATSRIGRFSDRYMRGIQERKAALSALEAKALFGDQFHRAIMEQYGPVEGLARWREMEQSTLSVDKGEVAMRWMATNMHLSNQHGEPVEGLMDLLNEHTFGAKLRVTHAASPGAITFRELEQHIDGVRQHDEGFTGVLFRDQRNAAGKVYERGEALTEHLKSLTQDDWMREAKSLKGIVVHDEAARTIWLMANGMNPEVFWRQYRPAYLQNVVGPTSPDTRRMRTEALAFHRRLVANVLAPAMGVTEAEFIARHFNPTNAVRIDPANAPFPLGARLDMRSDWVEETLKRDGPDVASTFRAFHEREDDYGELHGAFDDEHDFVFGALPTERLFFLNEKAMMPEEYRWQDAGVVLYSHRHSKDYSIVRLDPTVHPVSELGFGDYKARQPVRHHDIQVLDLKTGEWRDVGSIPRASTAPQPPPVPMAPGDLEKLYVRQPAPGEEAEAVAGIFAVDVETMLGPAHREGRRLYKSEIYGLINTYLRNIPYTGDADIDLYDLERIISDIDGLIARGALASDLPLYRGINLTRAESEFGNPMTIDYESLKPGDHIEPDPAFLSFSSNVDRAMGFATGGGHVYRLEKGVLHKGVMLYLNAPAGMRMGFLGGQEFEHLLPRGQGLRVVSHEIETTLGDYPTEIHKIVVEPTNNGRAPGVTGLAVEDLTGPQTVPYRLARDAILTPDALRAQAASQGLSHEGQMAVEDAIEEAASYLPPAMREAEALAIPPLPVREPMGPFKGVKTGMSNKLRGWVGDPVVVEAGPGAPNSITRHPMPAFGEGAEAFIARDSAGDAAGYLVIRPSSFEGGASVPELVEVRPDVRRMGIASRIYDEVQRQGRNIREYSGVDVTAQGRRFTDAYWERLDKQPVARYTPEQSLADDIEQLDLEEIDAAVMGLTDLRHRLREVEGTVSGSYRLMRVLAIHLADQRGIRMGWKEAVRVMEDLWLGDASTSTAEIQRALFKGIKPLGQEPLIAAERDALDAMLGNTSRNAVGRGEAQQPVLVDEFNMLDVGYAPGTTPNEYTHEYVVDFYNRKAAHANATKFGGANNWTASEMAQLASRRYQKLTGSDVLTPGAEIQRSFRTIPVKVKDRVDPESAMGQMGDLLSLYFSKGNRQQFESLMDELGGTIGQSLRDKLGLPVMQTDGAGVNIASDGTSRSHLPVTIIASDDRLNDAADVISYMTGQARVWSFRPTELTATTDLHKLVPRIVIRVPAQNSDEFTRQYVATLGSQLQAHGIHMGVTAMRKGNGDWELSVMDDQRRLLRTEDGRLDEDEFNEIMAFALEDPRLQGRNFPNAADPEYGIEYGSVYKAGPKESNNVFDWAGHREYTQELLQSRGSRITGEDLDDLRSTYEWSFKHRVQQDAPKQYRRWVDMEPLVPGRLEDRRGGTVRGYTDIDATERAVLAAVGAPDELTGLHELMHVFTYHLDASAKQRVIDLYNDWRTAARGDLNARIAATEARAAAAPAGSAARRTARNEALAMRSELGHIGTGVDWGPEHEEFVVRQFIEYIDTGRSPNPEMTNVIQHFRTYTQNLRSELHPPTGPQVPFSPEMEAFFNRVLKKPMRDMTHPYSVEHEIMRQTAKQTLRSAWDEAFGTHYYRKDRSWLERSVNHPYIGVYPASYMWGKVLPELFRFLALRPFGFETPLLAWNVLREVSDTMRYQSETNDDLKEFLSQNERAFMLINMLFPALPTEVPANVSLPVRRIAEQGLMNQMKFAKGIDYGDKRGQVHAVDYLAGLEDAVNYAIGPLGALRTGGEMVEMGFAAMRGDEEEEGAAPAEPFAPLGIQTP